MCLAVPARVVKLINEMVAVVDLGGVRREVSIALVDGVREDDFVIVHVGHAISRLDPEEAEKTLQEFRNLANRLEAEGRGSEISFTVPVGGEGDHEE